MKALFFCGLASAAIASAAVEFNRDIRPLLSDKCFTCHGPDNNNRKANLRLDREDSAKGALASSRPNNPRYAIVPGDPAKSALIERITHTNKALRMPPAYAGGQPLPAKDIELLRQWIAEGADWQKHWSFEPPRRVDPPQIRDAARAHNVIDHFIFARLEKEGLSPQPEADRATLIRRLALDLNGIPPTPAEIEAFEKDKSPNAYEKLVDRLLASPRYGERMAAPWLDAARYADTNGYQTDAERFMWRWRDWVIEAFNRNMPFDQFTIEQLAGDLLPNATLDQKIATGFNRNHRGNGEGGSIPEEFIVEYWVDRVDTTSTVFMGLTMGCSRCHDHKYDPITQRDYYSMVAFFNNINEMGRVFKYGNSPPMIPAPTREELVEQRAHDERLKEAKRQLDSMAKAIDEAQTGWEKTLAGSTADWQPRDMLLALYRLDNAAEGADRSGKPIKARFRDGEPQHIAGKIGQAAQFDGKRYVEAGPIGQFSFNNKFTAAAWIYPTAGNGAVITKSKDEEEGSGWGLYLKNGKLQANLVQRWLDDCLRLESEEPVTLNQWHHVAMSYDATRVAKGVRVYVDGQPIKMRIVVDSLNQNFQAKDPLRIGAGNAMRFQGAIDDARLYNDALTDREVAALALGEPLAALAAIPKAKRTEAQRDKMRWAFLEDHAPAPQREAWAAYKKARTERERFLASLPTVMVMKEMDVPRKTHILVRGAYDRPGEEVSRATPAALPPMAPDLPRNRLGFAKWLVSPEHPLTARVTVNRYWQLLFGTGIVRTVEDFGAQGESPVHPELLDWLATEFIRTGWDVKGILKTMVMSAAYRQDSSLTPEAHQKDPDNRLLSHGPRVRLPAEVVRDQALAMSGLLVEKIGGRSVKPYQPAGLWEELSDQKYIADHGEGLYRRSLYTYWKRSAPPPGMMTFDSSAREACTVRETRTNTPLQALTLMNDDTYLEAARKMAERMIREGGSAPPERISYGFRLATARTPNDRESSILLRGFRNFLDRYKTSPQAAHELLSQGESKADPAMEPSELAAYASVASQILNLDETVTKE